MECRWKRSSFNGCKTGGSVNAPRLVTYIDKDGNPHAEPESPRGIPEGAHYAVLDDYLYPNHDGIDFIIIIKKILP